MILRFLLFLFCLQLLPVLSQEPSSDEQELYELIMDYRASKGLPNIALSPSLTKVAQIHSKDLSENRPDQGKCNGHSWSNEGDWTPCCYTSDHKKASCMWDKPKELTSYQFPGYEISCVGSEPLSPSKALETWKKSKHHNAVIVNKDIWDAPWKAIGVGMFKGYATVWFGHQSDN
ncbi:MAG: hypothetical protein CBB76_01940 [Crocinitomicaceae bacterium TMED16]|nr:MAG: hypothetical protein CBB76_01940 [Crocinitomicaceae bacterium TMED16]